MNTLTHPFPHVQPTISIVGLPELLGDEPEPFHPSREDEAYQLGYELGRAGEDALCPFGDVALGMRFVHGRIAGERARAVDEARELGRWMGRRAGVSEPPSGFSPEEKSAYREGYAAGEARASARARSRSRARRASRPGPITDRDVYRVGATS